MRRLVYLDGARPDEGKDDSDDVDSELELKELRDAVVDVATPHDRLDNAGEVVVGQHDVRRLFGHVSARDTLSTPPTSQRSQSTWDVHH